jgi:hypothetical protein
MFEALTTQQGQDGEPWYPELHLILYIQQWTPYYEFFGALGWGPAEKGLAGNFEPRYLALLLASHWDVAKDVYPSIVSDYYQDPEGFVDKMNAGKWSGSRR